MGILAKEIEHKLTQILLDCRKEVLQNKGGINEKDFLLELDRAVNVFEVTNDKRTASNHIIALLIQYQLKYL